VVLAAALLALPACAASRARRTAEEGMALYHQGKYAEAMPLLQKALEAGQRTGSVLYQIGFCREAVDRSKEARQEAWKEAELLLEKESAAPGGSTLERLYYLTVINSDQAEFDRMTQYARQAIEQFEKGPDPNSLSGEDWFRLGRAHDFLQEISEAEAAYRRAASAFQKGPITHSTYRALTLARVADLDYNDKLYDSAADGYAEALKILPGTDQVKPFKHAIALLATRKYEEAIGRFSEDRDPATMDEAQYGADLARKAIEVAPLEEKDHDGSPIPTMPESALADRIKEASKEYRAVRVKHSLRPGDALPAEVAVYQRRFVRLLAEYLVRRQHIQEFCLQEGFADLVRR
jgi:tetratricopeptide (TPR) repeat protein